MGRGAGGGGGGGGLVKHRVFSENVLVGTEIPGGGPGLARLCRTLHCHHQNNSCLKIGSDDSHFNISLIVRGKVATEVTVSINHVGEPKRNRTEVLLLTSLMPNYR